jgi:protein involved in polysaccharide export with SLBB domain
VCGIFVLSVVNASDLNSRSRTLLTLACGWTLGLICLLSACTPMSVLRTPSSAELSARTVTPAQLAEMPPVPTRVRPGDTLRIIRDAQESASLDLRNLIDDAQTQNYQVQSDGRFAFRHAGTIDAAGKTPQELSQLLRTRLEPLFREPGVTVNIVASPSSKVVIGGAVRNPLTLELNAVANLEQALFTAGGLATAADPTRIALLRLDEKERYHAYFIDLSNVLDDGGVGRLSVALQRGDIVFVPKSSAGESAEGVDLYFNQLLPFSRSLGVGISRNVNSN